MNQFLYTDYRHKLNLAELLDRETVPLRTAETYALLQGKVVLVTGAAGSIGSELCSLILNDEPECLLAIDNNETGLFDFAQRMRSHPFGSRLHIRIGDITDKRCMQRIFTEIRPHIVFHAAAYKHVPLLERHPVEAICTNVLATYSLCQLARESGVARFVFISSDKAAEPVNVLGASKRLGELIVQAQSDLEGAAPTCFSSVRFGNVMGSRGSVIPIFAQQIEQGGPITVTHPDATRYFMTISEACGLVILTAAISHHGGLYLLDMGSPIRILDLATKMIRQHPYAKQDIDIIFTGLRPGECVHEKLVAVNEVLEETNYGKILCIRRQSNVPSYATIAQWMHTLESSLYHESAATLREYLLALVQEQGQTVLSSDTVMTIPMLARRA